ncbi:NusA-like transcription termination signal-binding factor [Candidatus Pacearchaeota archaeon CG_4_10_14_0_2_um_filter_05_32_18]|nr:MAG: NusA-like transcription termination signal-binding factor [Candidatus Pacearchaeota archaeon CG_4_10_14_0_2_um_filter_05_32_18]
MIRKIDMQHMRYLNLFSKITKINTQHCFIYNGQIIFVVPGSMVSRAIGDNGKNIRRISEVLNRKVKVVMTPDGIKDAEKFISTIIYPAQLKSVEVKDNILIINAGQQNKAMLIGRNKARLDEMKEIVKSYFGKEVKVV